MAARFSLDGNIIPRQVKRLFDQREEERIDAHAHTCTLMFRGRSHVVRLLNYSNSGAMVMFNEGPRIAELLQITMQGRGTLRAQVKWVREGKIGLTFLGPVE